MRTQTPAGYSEVEASLELIKGVTCPRFHADSVEVRCLCTLCGPGAWGWAGVGCGRGVH